MSSCFIAIIPKAQNDHVMFHQLHSSALNAFPQTTVNELNCGTKYVVVHNEESVNKCFFHILNRTSCILDCCICFAHTEEELEKGCRNVQLLSIEQMRKFE